MRDRRLDFWRGLCLVDMVLVHLVHEGVQFGAVGPLIVDYTRFAAGGFVFVAGIGVGFAAKLNDAARRGPAASVFWNRALYLLGIHYALTALVIVVEIERGWRAAAGPLAMLADILCWRIAPPYVDVLPLYVAMLAVAPLLIAMMRRGLWAVVAAASGIVFAYGRHDPTAWSPPASVEFPFLLWQAFFVGGLLFSMLVPRLDADPRRWRIAMALAWSAAIVVTVLANGPLSDAFEKVPLTIGELVRYLAVTLAMMTTSAVAWRSIRDGRMVRGIVVLGRRSLAVYGGHVFAQMAAIALVTPLWWTGGAQGLVAIPLLTSLYAYARGLDAATHPAPALRRTLRSWGAPPAGVAAAAALLLVTTRLPTSATDGVSPPEVATDRVVVDAEEHASTVDVVDVETERNVDGEAPGNGETPPADPPSFETLDEDLPVQSSLATPRYV